MQAWRHAQSTSTNCSIGLIRPGRRPTIVGPPDQRGSLENQAFYGKIKTSSSSRRHDPAQTPIAPRRSALQRTSTRRQGWFAGPAVTAQGKHPIPSRTRPLSPAAPMVLRLKSWESRSPPDPSTNPILVPLHNPNTAGWSSPVARQAHNLKVVGSNPTPATRISQHTQTLERRPQGRRSRVRTPDPKLPDLRPALSSKRS